MFFVRFVPRWYEDKLQAAEWVCLHGLCRKHHSSVFVYGPLPSNSQLLWLHISCFERVCHNIMISTPHSSQYVWKPQPLMQHASIVVVFGRNPSPHSKFYFLITWVNLNFLRMKVSHYYDQWYRNWFIEGIKLTWDSICTLTMNTIFESYSFLKDLHCDIDKETNHSPDKGQVSLLLYNNKRTVFILVHYSIIQHTFGEIQVV